MSILLRMSIAFLAGLTLLSVAAGIASAVFLHALEFTEKYRASHTNIYYLLPVAALLCTYLYKKWSIKAERGSNLLIDEIQIPAEKIPLVQTFLVFIGASISHLTGASIGREGVAVQMSGSLADTILSFFPLQKSDRKHLLLCSIAAGFSSILFAPLSGIVFAMEVTRQGKWEWKSIPPMTLAAFISLAITNLLFHHEASWSALSHYQQLNLAAPQIFFDFLAAILIGLCCALFARVFVTLTALFKKALGWHIASPYGGTFIGASILLILYVLVPYTQKFSGLGTMSIFYSFLEKSPWFDSVGKLIFTSLSIASGFRGGEIIPLFFMGSTFASFFLSIFPIAVSTSLIAAAFPAALSAATSTPLACAILAAELFGWNILPYSLVTCFSAYFFASKEGIYTSQIKISRKWPYRPWRA